MFIAPLYQQHAAARPRVFIDVRLIPPPPLCCITVPHLGLHSWPCCSMALIHAFGFFPVEAIPFASRTHPPITAPCLETFQDMFTISIVLRFLVPHTPVARRAQVEQRSLFCLEEVRSPDKRLHPDMRAAVVLHQMAADGSR